MVPTCPIERARARLPELDALPHPGSGATLARWRALAAHGADDLSFARLAEGHVDARAVLHELGRGDAAPDGALLGVWAARPAELRAEAAGAGWRLWGRKAWCSGSTGLDLALVTATAPDGPRLFLVDAGAATPEPGSWQPLGMAPTRSETLRFDVEVGPGAAVGGPGAYVARPGFGHGGCGVAACWWGGAVAVAERLRKAARDAEPDDGTHAALGAVDAALGAGRAVLVEAAAAIDDRPRDRDLARGLALRVRLAVAAEARTVLDRTGSALGASALCHDPDHARRVADLTVYLSQLHPFRSEAELGRLAATGEGPRL